MKRLSTQIYLVIIISLLVVAVVAALFWRRAPDRSTVREAFVVAGELAAVALAPEGAPPRDQQEALSQLAQRLRLNLSLFGADHRPIAAHGPLLPAPPEDRSDSGWVYGRGGPAWAIELPDGRWLVARSRRGPRNHPALSVLAFLGTISLVVALSSWPIVRGLTRRLEHLQLAVDKLGTGDLKARVPVEGRDEVAKLAQSFNRSAERIETLVGAHKLLLANASHELRTPLSRIRLGIEMMDEGANAARKAELARDIGEVDQLIEEILLASRLDALETLEIHEDVDLLALAAEEASRYDDVSVAGEPASVSGDPRLLRRMVRNLVENALKHGKPPVDVEVTRRGDIIQLTVADAGAGIPLAERDRVFEPFHRGNSSRQGEKTTRGTGLGLTLVREIARRHGGDAAILGPAGTSLFRITLPALAPASATTLRKGSPLSAARA